MEGLSMALPEPVASSASAGRGAGGEPGCGICGARPARSVILQGFLGLILLVSVRSYKGPLCRTCGIAMGRDLNNRSLTVGWWSIMSPIAVPMGVVANVLRMRSLSRLAPPGPPAVGMAAPLTVGPPVWRRPAAVIISLFMAPLSAALLVWLAVLIFS